MAFCMREKVRSRLGTLGAWSAGQQNEFQNGSRMRVPLTLNLDVIIVSSHLTAVADGAPPRQQR
jgi:hypothetical protein